MITHATGHGIDPFLLLTGIPVAIALDIVLLTDPRTFLPGMPFAAYAGVKATF